jgi:hypothetical protein
LTRPSIELSFSYEKNPVNASSAVPLFPANQDGTRSGSSDLFHGERRRTKENFGLSDNHYAIGNSIKYIGGPCFPEGHTATEVGT